MANSTTSIVIRIHPDDKAAVEAAVRALPQGKSVTTVIRDVYLKKLVEEHNPDYRWRGSSQGKTIRSE